MTLLHQGYAGYNLDSILNPSEFTVNATPRPNYPTSLLPVPTLSYTDDTDLSPLTVTAKKQWPLAYVVAGLFVVALILRSSNGAE